MDTTIRVKYLDQSNNLQLEANYSGFKEAMAAIFENFWMAKTSEGIKLKEYLKRVKISLEIR
jgi:hypothetical protein